MEESNGFPQIHKKNTSETIWCSWSFIFIEQIFIWYYYLPGIDLKYKIFKSLKPKLRFSIKLSYIYYIFLSFLFW